MSRQAVKPYLISKDEDGNFRLTIRDTRYNSQGYPLVTSTLQEDLFATATAARNAARDKFNAEPGEFATK
ncbi:hypothetical protein [Sphingobium ummariense]|uniref:DUF1508 domain-containing protein n=1 Tax=Sphingobium ummariense RL-3 TaxID=1346791 RepID=T0KFX4_9SPHN|nr:hypothetical protein [Sphingobium ummariense]EQB32343.1 hypothetical protein M529_10160 [Sphingobium ummariense RL-3]